MHKQTPVFTDDPVIEQCHGDLPDLVKITVYNPMLFAVHEFHIFNSFDVMSLIKPGCWYGIMWPADDPDPIVAQFDTVRSYEDMAYQGNVLACEIEMQGPVAIKAMYVVDKNDECLVIMTKDIDGNDCRMVVEYQNALFTFTPIH